MKGHKPLRMHFNLHTDSIDLQVWSAAAYLSFQKQPTFNSSSGWAAHVHDEICLWVTARSSRVAHKSNKDQHKWYISNGSLYTKSTTSSATTPSVHLSQCQRQSSPPKLTTSFKGAFICDWTRHSFLVRLFSIQGLGVLRRQASVCKIGCSVLQGLCRT